MKLSRILGTVGALALVVLNTSQASAYTTLKSASVRMADPSLSNSATNFSINFTQVETTAPKGIRFQFCTTASGACTPPTGLDTESATVQAVDGDLGIPGDWTVVGAALNGTIDITKAGQAAIPANSELSVSFDSITNGLPANLAATGCLVANNGTSDTSATCFIRISTFNDAAMVVDDAVPANDDRIAITTATYTLTSGVTVSARVDPTFTFTVTGVNSGTANVGGTGLTTSVTTTFDAIPFGNLTANQVKYASHQLKVVTNTQSGYSVEARMTQQLTGVYVGNNIDPFTAGGITWGAPGAWVEPSGAANVDSGYIGMNTTDTDVTGWGAVGSNFGPIDGTAKTVMTKASGGDNGAAPIYVTYAIEAGIYQPADTYTGRLVYNALPAY